MWRFVRSDEDLLTVSLQKAHPASGPADRVAVNWAGQIGMLALEQLGALVHDGLEHEAAVDLLLKLGPGDPDSDVTFPLLFGDLTRALAARLHAHADRDGRVRRAAQSLSAAAESIAAAGEHVDQALEHLGVLSTSHTPASA
ncbi:hypothetical protein ACFWWC_48675 [Streptomyces sp. NPDC058642]|uniref:hypothetical protein n=1 Tax=Streptomyces sp. NPDC058642 TaxID=3346572 RepID=UPI00365410F7